MYIHNIHVLAEGTSLEHCNCIVKHETRQHDDDDHQESNTSSSASLRINISMSLSSAPPLSSRFPLFPLLLVMGERIQNESEECRSDKDSFGH